MRRAIIVASNSTAAVAAIADDFESLQARALYPAISPAIRRSRMLLSDRCSRAVPPRGKRKFPQHAAAPISGECIRPTKHVSSDMAFCCLPDSAIYTRRDDMYAPAQARSAGARQLGLDNGIDSLKPHEALFHDTQVTMTSELKTLVNTLSQEANAAATKALVGLSFSFF